MSIFESISGPSDRPVQEPQGAGEKSDQGYERQYGFRRAPFSITPDPGFFYSAPSHERALGQLLRGLYRREGFMVLTGDIGTGKTMLCRALVERLGRKTFSAVVLNPFVSEEELLRVILQDFGVVSREELRRGALSYATRHQLVETLNEFLLSIQHLDATALVIIDEAQDLSPWALEQLRLLANLETDRHKLLQILLVGQLELEELLRSTELRQLDERVSRRCRLEPLTRAELTGYVDHRLRVARSALDVQFQASALDLVYEISGGVPRKVNLLCDRSLELASGHTERPVSPDVVRDAAANLGLDLHTDGAPRAGRRWFSGLVLRWAAGFAIASAGASGYGVGYLAPEPAMPPELVFSPIRSEVCSVPSDRGEG